MEFYATCINFICVEELVGSYKFSLDLIALLVVASLELGVVRFACPDSRHSPYLSINL